MRSIREPSFFRNILNLYLAGLLTLPCAQLCYGQAERDVLDQRVKDLSLKQPTINLALSSIAREYGIPIGIEMEAKGRGPNKIGVDIFIADGTIRDVLNAITKQNPDYTWEANDGVVNFYPKANR